MCESRKSLAEGRAVRLEKEGKRRKKRCQEFRQTWPQVMEELAGEGKNGLVRLSRV